MAVDQGDEMAKQMRPAVVGFAGPANVRTIPQHHETLRQTLQQNKAVELNLTGIEDYDLTFFQLIEAARRFAASTGKKIALSAPASSPLREDLLRGGFLSAAEDRAFWLHETGAP